MNEPKQYFAYSFAFHFAIFALVFLYGLSFPNKQNLFVPSVQIDMVALPSQVKTQDSTAIDQTLPVKDKAPPPKPVPQEAAPKPIPVPKMEKAVVKPAPKMKDPEVDAESAIEKLRREVEQAKANNQKQKLQKEKADLQNFKDQYRVANRGNQLHSGTNTDGSMTTTMNAYAGHVTERLRSNWSLPAWLQSANLRAVVRIYIDSSGNVINFQFTQKSGNESFDNYVKAAVQNSSPFAPPPNEMASGLRSGGMEVLFPL